MQVHFFGRIADAMGGSVAVEVPELGLTIAGLRGALAARHDCDSLKDLTVRAAVNDVIVDEACPVRPGDTVAFMSPLSGG